MFGKSTTIYHMHTSSPTAGDGCCFIEADNDETAKALALRFARALGHNPPQAVIKDKDVHPIEVMMSGAKVLTADRVEEVEAQSKMNPPSPRPVLALKGADDEDGDVWPVLIPGPNELN